MILYDYVCDSVFMRTIIVSKFMYFSIVIIRYLIGVGVIFFFKQKTEYEMRISDWSSDVCSSDLCGARPCELPPPARPYRGRARRALNRRKGRDQSKSEETLVSSAMRLIASPSSGATVRARTLALSLTASVGWIE